MIAFDPDGVDVEAVDRAFLAATRPDRGGDLDVVGYGEISVVFGWDGPAGPVVVKSLPSFDDPGRLEAYEALLAEYTETLADRGVHPVPTAVRSVRAEGAVRGYVLQPRLPARDLGPEVLGDGGADRGRRLLAEVVDAVARVVDDRVGLDAQISNWALTDERLWYLDVTTPMLRDAAGHDRLDTRAFATSLPWLLRAPVRRFVVPGILSPYHDRREVVLDMAGNLHKERLADWIEPLLAQANPIVDPPLTPAEVARFYRRNAWMWESLQRARQLDRWWQRQVRRRPYPFLIPPRIHR